MTPDLRDKWIAVLTSGDYRQGRGALVTITTLGLTYCCLGVLRDIANLEDGRSAYDDGQSLTSEQLGEYGLKLVDHHHLVTLNDGDVTRKIKVQTFNQIATWIGENL